MHTESATPHFLYCSRCGSARLAVRCRSFQCEDCSFEHFINPIVAVAVIVADRAGEILLIRRAKDPGKGKLGLPGGFVEPGETGEEAARREVMEEVNLQLDRLAYQASFPNQYHYQGIVLPVLDLFYTATVDSFSAARPLTEVQSLTRVAPLELDFDEIAFPSIEKALKCYAQSALANDAGGVRTSALPTRLEM